MKKYLIVSFFVFLISLCTAGNSPYPIIFVHGLKDSDKCFLSTMRILNTKNGNSPDDIKIYDVILNADNDNGNSLLADDVKDTPFILQKHNDVYAIYPGKRMYAESVNDYDMSWHGDSQIFAVNFDSKRIKGTLGEVCDLSNQAAIYKQGCALGKMIQKVLDYTGKDKVILVGHSLGGLAIREYLQRTDTGMPNSLHTWWVDKNDEENGHKVARVITIDTPHLGSNSSIFEPLVKTREFPWEALPDEYSEAVRDLRVSHNSLGVELNGVYLFGGMESIPALLYHNFDTNCNGNETDYITGLNSGTVANPAIKLPDNIPYTWVTSDCGDGDNSYWNNSYSPGDGVVFLERQYLYSNDFIPSPVGLADTLFTHYLHTSLPGIDHESVLSHPEVAIRALDEPDTGSFAYLVEPNKWYSGFITYQQDMSTMDIDFYKMEVSIPSLITCELWTNQTGLHHAYFTDSNFVVIHEPVILADGQNIITFTALPGTIYIKLVGDAYGGISGNNASTDDAYDFYITSSQISMTARYHATPLAGNTETNFHFYDDSTTQNTTITTWQWDFNGDGEVESTEQNPVWVYDTPGTYNVILRVTDGSGAPGNDGIHADYEMKMNYIIVNGLPSGNDNEIVWMEYFIDTDPGINNGEPIFLIPAPDITADVSINIGNLSEGLHRLYIRALDSNGKWGLPQCKPFIVQQTSPQQPLPNITQMEYFIDTNVSPGSGTSVPISSSSDVTATTNVALNNLTEGLHRMYVRAKDANGRWGLPQCKPFIVQQTSPQQPLPNITQMEYFIDTSVNPGSGTSVPISPSNDVTATTNVTLNNLSEGLHRMYVRAKDANGRWGLPQCKPFIVQQTSPFESLPTITEMEYFYDTDPGIGQGSPIAVSPSSDVTVNATLPVSDLDLGNHTLYLRAKDSLDRWGLPQSIGFQLVVRPDTPKNAEITIRDGVLEISWDSVTQVTGYKVYASDNSVSGFADITNQGTVNLSRSRMTWTTSLSTAAHQFYYVKSHNSERAVKELLSSKKQERELKIKN